MDTFEQEQPISESGNVKSDRNKSEMWEWSKAILLALIIVMVIRVFFFSPFVVSGQSMEPNFHDGERLIVDKILYKIRTPKKGEVIIFQTQFNKPFIKRVIALPGETVRVDGDKVYVNGKQIEEPYLQAAIAAKEKLGEQYNDKNFPNSYIQENKVPAGKVFVMGDNRSNSEDSRFIGYIDDSQIIGRADLSFWPLSEAKWIP
ncbi:MAG: signal peptidase I [Paenibacillus sp. RIFOXYA1_FULL_44_5]|nr:MAG: signal peptidase I [Paenibacillus sp. RIFOXYA1_FULL_44_5]